jgi:hypothetical protein
MRACTPAKVAAIALCAAGCNPVYAPPVRSTHDGAAGRVGRNELEIGGSVNPVYSVGGAWVGVPTLDTDLRLEAGADIGPKKWMMGWLGGRYTFADRNEEDHVDASGPALDLEGGVGAGVGGRNSDEDDPDTPDDEEIDWSDRLAGGGYWGLGAAYQVKGVFAPWIRARMQVTGADDIPATLWGSALIGVEAGYRVVHVFAGTGIVGYANQLDDAWGWSYFEGGLAFHFPVD